MMLAEAGRLLFRVVVRRRGACWGGFGWFVQFPYMNLYAVFLLVPMGEVEIEIDN